MAHDRIVRGAVVGRGMNIAFVPDVGSYLRICLESETYVCSFSSEFLFSFELFNLFVFFYVCSASAVLLFPLCAALRRYASRARPRHCCLQLYLGAEPEGLDPYCYCMFYYYYYYYSSLPMGVYGSPMKGTWENDEIWHTCRDGYE